MNAKNSACFLILILCLAALSNPVFAQVGEARIKIGVSAPLSGPAATYGIDLKSILEFANKEIGGNRYDLVFEDDRCDSRTVAGIARKFADVDRIKYVLGIPCSGGVLAAAPIYESAHVLVISSGASADSVSGAGDWIFRTWPSDGSAAKVLAKYIRAKHRRVAVLSEQTEFCEGLAKNLMAAGEGADLEFISENILPGDVDVRPVLARLKEKKPDALVVNTQSESGFIPVVEKLREIKWATPLYGFYWPGTGHVLAALKEKDEGIIFSDSPGLDIALNPEGAAMYARFVAEYGPVKTIPFFFVSTIEAFRADHEAIMSGRDPRDFLYSHSFDGVGGPYHFDGNGDIIGVEPVLKIVRMGRIESL